MDRFKSLEEKLEGLVPSPLSEGGERMLEDRIDELAGVDSEARPAEQAAPTVFWSRRVAAVVLVLAIPVVMIQMKPERPDDTSLAMLDADLAPSVPVHPEMILLKSTKLIDGREDDGLIVPADGAAPHYRYRYRVVDEEQVRDPETGAVITLRQPRQEVVTIPVTEF